MVCTLMDHVALHRVHRHALIRHIDRMDFLEAGCMA